MSYKRPFDDVMQEFITKHPGDIDKLTAEEIAERTGYSVPTVRDYLRRLPRIQESRKQKQEEEQRRVRQSVAYTYNTSSGTARVIYYPLSAEIRIINPNQKQFGAWGPETPSILLSPQDAFEISIYLLGLQPHIRDALARNEKPISSTEEPETAPIARL